MKQRSMRLSDNSEGRRAKQRLYLVLLVAIALLVETGWAQGPATQERVTRSRGEIEELVKI